MSTNLLRRIEEVIEAYYPKGRSPSDPLFEKSIEWARQSTLRDNTKLHSQTILHIEELFSRFYFPSAIDDNSCPSVNPSYHFRILLQPQTGWPDQTEWNWDLKFLERFQYAVYLNVFFSYLGPFCASVVDELKHEDQQFMVRREPAKQHKIAQAELARLQPALEQSGWLLLPTELLQEIVPGFMAYSELKGKTVFELLFSTTYAEPGRWDGEWDIIDPGMTEAPNAALDESEKTLGELVGEALLRNEIGFDPELRRKPSRQ